MREILVSTFSVDYIEKGQRIEALQTIKTLTIEIQFLHLNKLSF